MHRSDPILVLPTSPRERIATLDEMSDGLGRRPHPDGERCSDPGADVTVVMDVAVACRRDERARFDYRSATGEESRRHVEPYRLVTVGNRWYLVAFDLDRDNWRTFRVDRIDRWVTTGIRSSERERPDAAGLVAEGIAVRVFETQALVRIHLPRTEVERIVGPNVAVIDPDSSTDTATTIRIGGPGQWVANYLIALPCPFDVVEPDDLRAEVARQAHAIFKRHRSHGGDGLVGRRAPIRGSTTRDEVIPYLAVHDAAAAIDWYVEVFGAVETLRYTGDDERIGHADLSLVGSGVVYLADEHPDHDHVSPRTLGGSSTAVHLQVDDVDASYATAVAAGATSRRPPTDEPHGERVCTIVDPFGHRWMIVTPISSPEEEEKKKKKKEEDEEEVRSQVTDG